MKAEQEIDKMFAVWEEVGVEVCTLASEVDIVEEAGVCTGALVVEAWAWVCKRVSGVLVCIVALALVAEACKRAWVLVVVACKMALVAWVAFWVVVVACNWVFLVAALVWVLVYIVGAWVVGVLGV